MAKMDLTQAFYEIAKARGPGDYSKIYQQRAMASLAVPTAIAKASSKILNVLQFQKNQRQKITDAFNKVGHDMFLKLHAAPVGKDEALNQQLFDATYDYYQSVGVNYGKANNAKDEKGKIKYEAEAGKIINTIAKFRSDLLIMTDMVKNKQNSSAGTGSKMEQVLGAIINQDSGYDDVEVMWSDKGLVLRVTTEDFGVVDMNAKDMLGSLKGKPVNSEGSLINVTGSANQTAAAGKPWNDTTVASKAKEVIDSAFDNDEFASWCGDKLYGSEESYHDALLKHPEIAGATYKKWGMYVGDHGPHADWVDDVGGPEGKPDGIIDEFDFEGDVGADNKLKLIDALTDPTADGYNKEIAEYEAQRYVEGLIKQQTELGNIEYNKQELKKKFEKDDTTIEAQEKKRSREEVFEKISKINEGVEFWDWGRSGKTMTKWIPVGKDLWAPEDDLSTVYSREELLTKELKIQPRWWGESYMKDPGKGVLIQQPFGQEEDPSELGKAPPEFVDKVKGSLSDDAQDNVNWLKENFPVAGYTYEVEGRDEIKISGFGEEKIIKLPKRGRISGPSADKVANEIWKFMFENFEPFFEKREVETEKENPVERLLKQRALEKLK